MEKLLILFWLVCLMACTSKSPDYDVLQPDFSEAQNRIRKVHVQDYVNYYSGDDIVASEKTFAKDTSNYSVFTKYFPLGRRHEMVLHEEIFYWENGEIIEDSSLFYTCQVQGDHLQITYCSYGKNDFCKIVLNAHYDADFVPTKQGDTVTFSGNTFLLKNYKQYCSNDTLRAFLMPRIETFPDSNTRYTYAMVLVEFPNRYNFAAGK